jgi:histidinol-phosphate aminotransferase
MRIYSPIYQFPTFQPGKSIEMLEHQLGMHPIKLASNENPLGPSVKAMQAAQKALQKINIYPDSDYRDLKQSLSAFLSIPSEQFTIGNGSENILELIIKAYLHKNDAAVISQYTFLTIPILIRNQDANLIIVPTHQWGHDVRAIIKAIDAQTRVLFIVNPSNPTGTYINTEDFHLLMESVPQNVLIVIDEAYFEYIATPDFPSTINYLNISPNLIITRTFSKAYGLAALRLGYAISSKAIADKLNAVRLPYNVNMIAAKAGEAAIADQAHIQKSLYFNQQGLQQIETGLKKLKLSYIPSITNFITIEVGNGQAIYQQLLQKGIIVRPLSAYGMPAHIRVSIGKPSEIEQFLETLSQLI